MNEYWIQGLANTTDLQGSTSKKSDTHSQIKTDTETGIVLNLDTVSIHEQKKDLRNKYVLKFQTETKEELEKRKKESFEPVIPQPDNDLERGCDEFFPESISFPKRPSWEPNDDESAFDAKENRYFFEYCKSAIESTSFFDLNLETWRQLWRVTEKADILFVIVDIRFASVHFPPALYRYIVNELEKKMILVLNKIDLVPSSVVAAWKDYFSSEFPGISVVYFTSLPAYNLANPTASRMKGAKIRGSIKMAAEGALRVYQECEKIVEGKVDLSTWKELIMQQLKSDFVEELKSIVSLEPESPQTQRKELYSDRILTIGAIGHPNVGKSSVLNALTGRKVVSVSKTPGHTKHFQTVNLTNTVKLLDCPGLVFPSKAPKNLQVLAGCYPISQLREPYSAIRFMAEHINIPSRLHLIHQSNEIEWSPYDICDAWAVKCGFRTRKGGKSDVYRAANKLLRAHLGGALGLYLRPPNYTSEQDHWQRHPLISEIEEIQALGERITVFNKEISEEESNEESDVNSDDEKMSEKVKQVENKYAALELDD
ncbi:hypothetical protein QYM36_007422 [Artemia franciscana]|uniref:Guanine nucleotide-binding protein-like 1 n=1 Tax=Artemia franciscana TaxID=6661 RepID=A0AA88IG33_ARTSF|nr:hypothetical protein QYM36_007422 [Artemia franciscana]